MRASSPSRPPLDIVRRVPPKPTATPSLNNNPEGAAQPKSQERVSAMSFSSPKSDAANNNFSKKEDELEKQPMN